MEDLQTKIKIEQMDLFYGNFQALKNINLEIYKNQITAFIGPSGCGKSTLLKSLNRMNDMVEGCKIIGTITLDNEDIYIVPIEITSQYSSRVSISKLQSYKNNFAQLEPLQENLLSADDDIGEN